MTTDPSQSPRIEALWRSVLRDLATLREITGRPFPLDGHPVGSMGEVLAASRYGLTLSPPSTRGYDAVDADNRRVESKATCGKAVYLSAVGPDEADRLIVVRLPPDADAEPGWVYDGPTAPAWAAAGGAVIWTRQRSASKSGRR